jgi:hypothetical protein
MSSGNVKLTEKRTSYDDVSGGAEGLFRSINAGLLSSDIGRAGPGASADATVVK